MFDITAGDKIKFVYSYDHNVWWLPDRAAYDAAISSPQAQALLPAIFVKFPLAHSMTISQSGRRAGPLPLVVAGF